MALVHSEKSFKYLISVLRCYPYAGISHRKAHLISCLPYGYGDPAADLVVLDRVVAQVIDDLIEQPPDTVDHSVIAIDLKGDILCGCGVRQRPAHLLRQCQQRYVLPRHIVALVQL